MDKISKDTMFCDTPEYKKEIEDHYEGGEKVEFVKWEYLRLHIKDESYNLAWTVKSKNGFPLAWDNLFYRKVEKPEEPEWEYLYKIKFDHRLPCIDDVFYVDYLAFEKNNNMENIEWYEKQEWSKSRCKK